jgi:hypothetical protein
LDFTVSGIESQLVTLQGTNGKVTILKVADLNRLPAVGKITGENDPHCYQTAP